MSKLWFKFFRERQMRCFILYCRVFQGWVFVYNNYVSSIYPYVYQHIPIFPSFLTLFLVTKSKQTSIGKQPQYFHLSFAWPRSPFPSPVPSQPPTAPLGHNNRDEGWQPPLPGPTLITPERWDSCRPLVGGVGLCWGGCWFWLLGWLAGWSCVTCRTPTSSVVVGWLVAAIVVKCFVTL